MRNITTDDSYKMYCKIEIKEYVDEIVDDNLSIDRKVELLDLKKFDSATLRIGLRNVWDESRFDVDFDMCDFSLLCKQFEFKVSEILGSNRQKKPYKVKGELTKSGNSQLALIF